MKDVELVSYRVLSLGKCRVYPVAQWTAVQYSLGQVKA